MTTSTTSRSKKIRNYVLVAVLWIALWELAAYIINEELLFVSPRRVIITLFTMARSLTFWKTVLASVARVLCGFLLGYALSAVLAVLSYCVDFIYAFLSPAVSVIKATPVASFIILALMWSGKNYVPLLVCVLMVIPIVWSNLMEGLRSMDRGLLEMARTFRMSWGRKMRHVVLPSLMPYLAAAAGSGLGLCWKAGIAAEVICRTTPSIGNGIWETKFYLLTDEMFAWTTVVVLLSVIFDRVTRQLLSRMAGRGRK